MSVSELRQIAVLARKIEDADRIAWDALYDAIVGQPAQPNHLDARMA